MESVPGRKPAMKELAAFYCEHDIESIEIL